MTMRSPYELLTYIVNVPYTHLSCGTCAAFMSDSDCDVIKKLGRMKFNDTPVFIVTVWITVKS